MYTNELAIIDHDKYDLNVIYRMFTRVPNLPANVVLTHNTRYYYNIIMCAYSVYYYIPTSYNRVRESFPNCVNSIMHVGNANRL